jgi:hypothetical protein
MQIASHNHFVLQVWQQKTCLNCHRIYHCPCDRLHCLCLCSFYKVVQTWSGLFVCKQVTVCPGHIWTTLYLWCAAVTVLSLSRNSNNQTSFVASVITWSQSRQPIRTHLQGTIVYLKIQHIQGAMLFDWSGCDSNMAHVKFFIQNSRHHWAQSRIQVFWSSFVKLRRCYVEIWQI